MRVGIMGGTLDPVHMGHIQIAETALREMKLDRIMLLPAGDPPHKAHPTPKADRWRMAQLAAETVTGMFACSVEIGRTGTTYTVDTLRDLHICNPNTQWYYLIGADTLDVLDSWRCFDQVAKMCTFVVAGRGDEPASAERMASRIATARALRYYPYRGRRFPHQTFAPERQMGRIFADSCRRTCGCTLKIMDCICAVIPLNRSWICCGRG